MSNKSINEITENKQQDKHVAKRTLIDFVAARVAGFQLLPLSLSCLLQGSKPWLHKTSYLWCTSRIKEPTTEGTEWIVSSFRTKLHEPGASTSCSCRSSFPQVPMWHPLWWYYKIQTVKVCGQVCMRSLADMRKSKKEASSQSSNAVFLWRDQRVTEKSLPVSVIAGLRFCRLSEALSACSVLRWFRNTSGTPADRTVSTICMPFL